MMKTNNEMSATPSYIAPVAKVINAKLEGLICLSNYGDAGRAGGPLGINDDDEEAY